MHKTYLLIVLLLGLCTVSYAQQQKETKVTLLEAGPDGMVRFYFDDHYFLVDKDCSFKSLERIAGYLPSENKFHGAFKDFDNFGKLRLQGSYHMGLKEGVFQAFHANGTEKWRVLFKDDQPVGTWHYFYPDGKPMIEVDYQPQGVVINSFWNQRGKQTVVEGTGSYSFTMPFTSFNEYGYSKFTRKGKLKMGVPVGLWTVEFVDHEGTSVRAAEDYWDGQGKLRNTYNYFTETENAPTYNILPAESFLEAETLTFKQCTYDEYSGYANYLSLKLTNLLSGSENITQKKYLIEYDVQVDEHGKPSRTKVNNINLSESEERIFNWAINRIPYYFPTVVGEEAVVDTLQIRFTLSQSVEGKYLVYPLIMKRKREQ